LGSSGLRKARPKPRESPIFFRREIAKDDIRSIVVNMEHKAFDQGLAKALANHLNAPCYTLDELRAESLYRTVKQEIGRY